MSASLPSYEEQVAKIVNASHRNIRTPELTPHIQNTFTGHFFGPANVTDLIQNSAETNIEVCIYNLDQSQNTGATITFQPQTDGQMPEHHPRMTVPPADSPLVNATKTAYRVGSATAQFMLAVAGVFNIECTPQYVQVPARMRTETIVTMLLDTTGIQLMTHHQLAKIVGGSGIIRVFYNAGRLLVELAVESSLIDSPWQRILRHMNRPRKRPRPPVVDDQSSSENKRAKLYAVTS